MPDLARKEGTRADIRVHRLEWRGRGEHDAVREGRGLLCRRVDPDPQPGRAAPRRRERPRGPVPGGPKISLLERAKSKATLKGLPLVETAPLNAVR